VNTHHESHEPRSHEPRVNHQPIDPVGAPNWTMEELGNTLFKYRDYTPIALLIFLFIICSPTVGSAVLGMLLIMLGELIRMVSVGFIGSISRTRNDSTGARLVTTGPYGIVRNPLYVGNFFITLGVTIFGGPLWFVILTMILFAIQYWAIITYEESLLEEKFGDDFRRYREQVPAFFPRSLSEPVDWNFNYPIPAILKSEKRTLTAVAFVIFVLVLRS
jgi:protein-S-isoprenylcysteine O-methyltransferase Ste14